MNCPVCSNQLSPVRADQVVVDACVGGCGGIWFDNFELQRLDDPDEAAGEMLVAVNRAGRDEAHRADPARKRRCPKCVDIVMMRHFFSPQCRVEIDECPGCGGYWLDAGELAVIREQCKTEVECRQAVDEFLSTATRQKLDEMRAGSPEDIRRARALGQLLRFSRPIRFQRQGA